MNKKLLLLLSIITCIAAPIKGMLSNGYIYNYTKSKLYYGNENSTNLSSIAPDSYCYVNNYYIVYPQNNPNGPALKINLEKNPDTKKLQIKVYKCYVTNGKISVLESTPVSGVYPDFKQKCVEGHWKWVPIFFAIVPKEYICTKSGDDYLSAEIFESTNSPILPLIVNPFDSNGSINQALFKSPRGNIFNNTSSPIYFHTLGNGTIYTIAPNQNFNVGMGEKFLVYPTNNPNGKALYLEYNDDLGRNMFKTCFAKDKNIDSSMPQGPEQIVYGHIQIDSDPTNGLTITGN